MYFGKFWIGVAKDKAFCDRRCSFSAGAAPGFPTAEVGEVVIAPGEKSAGVTSSDLVRANKLFLEGWQIDRYFFHITLIFYDILIYHWCSFSRSFCLSGHRSALVLSLTVTWQLELDPETCEEVVRQSWPNTKFAEWAAAKRCKEYKEVARTY